jgi:hypothetical protein
VNGRLLAINFEVPTSAYGRFLVPERYCRRTAAPASHGQESMITTFAVDSPLMARPPISPMLSIPAAA